MQAAAQTEIATPAAEVEHFIMVTPRKRNELPFFIRNPVMKQGIQPSDAHGLRPDDEISGELVTERGKVVNAAFKMRRHEMRKTCRAIKHDSGVLVPV